MDTVRFGRVLGQGARQAAKTLVSAVDAATAPDPRQPAARPPASTTRPPSAPAAAPLPVQTPPLTAASAQPTPTSATAPASAATAAQPTPSRAPRSVPAVLPPVSPTNVTARATTTTRGLAEGSRRFGKAVWAPAVRLSGVLWLELTGVFFALFALVAGIATWRLRSALHLLSAAGASATPAAASDDRTRLLFAAGMVLVFGYFSLSSFLKANRRSRRP